MGRGDLQTRGPSLEAVWRVALSADLNRFILGFGKLGHINNHQRHDDFNDQEEDHPQYAQDE